EEECKSMVNSVRKCDGESMRKYGNKIVCVFCLSGVRIHLNFQRQIRCDFVHDKVGLVYEGNSTSEIHSGDLTCVKLAPERAKRNPCPYTCAESAICSETKLVCACLKGYVDVSSQYNKEAGRICTKCNNSDPVGTDYIMLFDESESTIPHRPKMVDFLASFLQFIDIDHTDNR
ncbi:hypothetical protein PFISCL1PPCAC_21658, partial [Pristionchus fissidentatus]